MESQILELAQYLSNQAKENPEFVKNILTIYNLKKRIVKDVDEAVNLDEIERMAFSKMNMNGLSYFMSGANDELTLDRNIRYFKKILLYPKILKNVSSVDISTTVLGSKISLPVMIAPTALHRLTHDDGELATARAAKNANTILILSALSSKSIADVAKVSGDTPRWFQLYVLKNEQMTLEVVKTAERNGYTGLVVTVDAPILGVRERDFQVKFKVPPGIKYENLQFAIPKTKKDNNMDKMIKETGGKSEIFEFFAKNMDTTMTWEIVRWLKLNTSLKIILKGVHRVDDALIAQSLGVDAIIVSNHGARQLDGVPSGIEMLYPIAKAVKKIPENKMEIYVDGGIRRGTDIFKAIALGADCVLLGRPILWGLACSGEKGATKVLDMLKNELIVAMKLSGVTSLKEINEDYVRIKDSFGKF